MTERKFHRSPLIVGGMSTIGVGVGFIFLQTSPLLFVASILIGVGLGLVLASLLQGKK
jgi:hypothetical protein